MMQRKFARSKIDLNLLTIFCLIYSVGSISRVADMLNISPSAVSQSLRKLREMMGIICLSAAKCAVTDGLL